VSAKGEVGTMRHSLAVAVWTWLLAFVFRACAQSFLETLENSRQVMPPLVGWLTNGRPVEIPAVTAIVVPMILYAIALAWWRLRLTWPASTALGLFVGGAAANTSERLAFGGVTDYIPISWSDTYLANFADLAIVTGTVLLAGALLHSCAVRCATCRSEGSGARPSGNLVESAEAVGVRRMSR
jgi:signal peptidase (SPase) II